MMSFALCSNVKQENNIPRKKTSSNITPLRRMLEKEVGEGLPFFNVKLLDDFVSFFKTIHIQDPAINALILCETHVLPTPMDWLTIVVEKMSERVIFPRAIMRCWFDGKIADFESGLGTFLAVFGIDFIPVYYVKLNHLFCHFICETLNGRLFFENTDGQPLFDNILDITTIKYLFKKETETKLLSDLSLAFESLSTKQQEQRHIPDIEVAKAELVKNTRTSQRANGRYKRDRLREYSTFSSKSITKTGVNVALSDDYEIYQRLMTISNGISKNNLHIYYNAILAEVQLLANEQKLKKLDLFKLLSGFIALNIANSSKHQDKLSDYAKSEKRSDTKALFDYVTKGYISTKNWKIHIPAKNFHTQLCSKCNKSPLKFHTKHKLPLIKIVKQSLKMMFNFFGALRSYGFRFVCIDAENSFLPANSEKKAQKCKLGNIGFSKIYSKIHDILLNSLGYALVEGDSAIFVHAKLGYVLPYRTKMLVLSKVPDDVFRAMLNFMNAAQTYRNIEFLDREFSPEPDYVEIESDRYISTVCSSMFDSSAVKYISRGAQMPITDGFLLLNSPPNGLPDLVTEKYIRDMERSGQLKWPKELVYDKSFDVKKLKKYLDVLNYITWDMRADVEYHTALLNTYSENPNKLVYLALVHLFAYLQANPYNTLRDALPRANDLDVEIKLPFFNLDGQDRVRVHSNSVVAFATNLWITKSERIDITELGNVGERIRTVQVLLEEMLPQFQSFKSLSAVGLDKKPNYRMIVFNSKFYMALQNRSLPHTEPGNIENSFKRILEIIDLFDIEIYFGPLFERGL